VREVILIGGPYDGKATEVTDDLPLYWRIVNPWRPQVHEVTRAEVVENTITMSVSRYERMQMHWGRVNTNVVLYRWAGQE
jgi:hypothetical protein